MTNGEDKITSWFASQCSLPLADFPIGIGGDMALLGQDVYGEYGLSIGGHSIDLYE